MTPKSKVTKEGEPGRLLVFKMACTRFMSEAAITYPGV